MDFYHEPVMASECIEALNIKENGVYVDGTAGGGGHSLLIAQKLKEGRLLCIDRDIDAINSAKERLKSFNNTVFVKDNYKNLSSILAEYNIGKIDGILIDMGISSFQIDNGERGFSYMKDAPLDMRMDKQGELTAGDVINGYSEKELVRIFFQYGEERYSKRIASAIVSERERKPVETTLELVSIIERALPAREKQKQSHPAKRVFQAARIEVNGELEELGSFIKGLPSVLNNRGRIAVITFHSLEDRIIKHSFYDMQFPCKCPSELPVCVCGQKSAGKAVFKKPVTAGEDERIRNSRSKSAKLRVFEKI